MSESLTEVHACGCNERRLHRHLTVINFSIDKVSYGFTFSSSAANGHLRFYCQPLSLAQFSRESIKQRNDGENVI